MSDLRGAISTTVVTAHPNGIIVVDNNVLSILSSMDRRAGGGTSYLDSLFDSGRQVIITDTVLGESDNGNPDSPFMLWLNSNLESERIQEYSTGIPHVEGSHNGERSIDVAVAHFSSNNDVVILSEDRNWAPWDGHFLNSGNPATDSVSLSRSPEPLSGNFIITTTDYFNSLFIGGQPVARSP